MNKILVVLRREFVSRVRTKAFIISTLLLPVFISAVVVLPALLSRSGNHTSHVAIVDATGDSLGLAIQQALTAQRLTGDSVNVPRYQVDRVVTPFDRLTATRDSLVALTGVSRNKMPQSLDGVMVVDSGTRATGKLEYLGSNTSALEAMGELEGTVSKVLIGSRLQRSGVDPAIMATAMRPADMQTVKVANGKATDQTGASSFFVAYFMGFILYLTMIIYGQQTLTSVIEEKTSRIMEVLLSSLRPFQMLLGKILGVGLTGLLQLGIWGGFIFLLSNERGAIAHVFGVSAEAMQSLSIPTMPPDLLAVFLLYFVLGFLLYGAVYAAVGSMFNAVQEAQQVAMFVQMAIMVGFFALFAVIKDPTGSLGVTMSYIPFFSPFIMPARWSLTSVPMYQLAISLSLSVAALVAVAWLAGRIYRTGVLMYGKKPSLAEVFRWVRAK
jgi:ABC-2 type transport system permease protein